MAVLGVRLNGDADTIWQAFLKQRRVCFPTAQASPELKLGLKHFAGLFMVWGIVALVSVGSTVAPWLAKKRQTMGVQSALKVSKFAWSEPPAKTPPPP
mmetsp:Transcript_5910/g.13020  ORF Transcript_5910/g.13020 Transcript_5910/m.13020 type:complete len:98 (-) Transcript_5910:157-450(-)